MRSYIYQNEKRDIGRERKKFIFGVSEQDLMKSIENHQGL